MQNERKGKKKRTITFTTTVCQSRRTLCHRCVHVNARFFLDLELRPWMTSCKASQGISTRSDSRESVIVPKIRLCFQLLAIGIFQNNEKIEIPEKLGIPS